MSLDNIQLPGFIMGDLFQKSLVDLSNIENKINTTTKEKEINFFGGNKQHIILLVNNADTLFVTDQQLTFLSGVLNACKLTLEDIALINIAALQSISYQAISDNFNPRIIFLFGISPEKIELPFMIPQFQRQFYNNRVYLSVPSLNELENDKELKRKLWVILQQIFSL